MRTVSCVVLMLFCVGATALAQPVPQEPAVAALTDFQKETISSVRDITLQLLLLAVGVFALMGGFVSSEKRTFTHILLGWASFLLLGISVVAGLVTYGSLVYMLGNDNFDLFGPFRIPALIQWTLFGFGGFAFMLFVLLNMKRHDGAKK